MAACTIWVSVPPTFSVSTKYRTRAPPLSEGRFSLERADWNSGSLCGDEGPFSVTAARSVLNVPGIWLRQRDGVSSARHLYGARGGGTKDRRRNARECGAATAPVSGRGL